MFKKLLLAFLIASTCLCPVFAFTVAVPVIDQVDTQDGVTVSGGYIELAKSGIQLQNLFINPNFPAWRDMYLSTDQGVYLNRQYSANWSKHAALSATFPNGFKELKFSGNYSSNKTMLAYSPDKIYLSYNNGDNWADITPTITEAILFADFGPGFDSNNQIYFITDSGLYRKSLSNDQISQVVASTTSGSIRNFRYVRTQTSDSAFYVVNGNKILKTENFGTSFMEYTFNSKIVDFEIEPKTLTSGDLIVLTEDNKIFYASTGFSFYELDLPAEINTVYSVDYIIFTDQGFYVSYTNGDSWSKLDYDPAKVNDVKDYDFVVDGSQKNLYVINENKLYKDYDLVETFEDYTNGLDISQTYLNEGTAISKNMLDLNVEKFEDTMVVTSAVLTADGDLNSQTIEFYMTADGINWEAVEQGVNYTFTNPGRDLRWKAVLKTTDTAVTPVLRSVNIDFGLEELMCAGFKDIPANDPHCLAVQYVKDQGIFSGYPDGTFMPDLAINRAETVKVIVEGFDKQLLNSDGTNLGFSDVGVNEWYMGYLKTAFEGGIIEGYPDGTFKPAQIVNYAELIKIFLETSGVTISESTTPNAQWYKKYVDYADANGLVLYTDVSTGMKRVDVAELFYQWSLK